MKTVDILLPCLNEEKTLEECINRINKVIEKDLKKYDCKIVVCDNNSTDSSIKIAKKNKVKVLVETKKGYGATLLNGIHNSKADYIVMLDCDLSYNEKDIPRFIKELENGYDLVMGNRFLGNIEDHAMPKTHSIGSRLLTLYANLLFHTPSHDYHSGLRAFNRESFMKCNCKTEGFEFASEMIIRFQMNHFKIKEIETDLFVDGRNRKPHLKSIKDGLRHLQCITSCKIEKSKIFRYLIALLIYLILLLIIILGNNSISNNQIKKNRTDSIEYLNHNNSILLNTKEEIKLLENKTTKGTQVLLRYYLVLFPINNSFYFVIIIGIIALLGNNIYQLFKISKSLAISYIICIISMIISYEGLSIYYGISFIVSILFTSIIIHMMNKDNMKIGLFFSINGFISGFLGTNLIPLLFPLLLYYFMKIEKESPMYKKRIISYIIIWILFYSIFLFRMDYHNIITLDGLLISIKNSLNNLIPFQYIGEYAYIGIIILLLLLLEGDIKFVLALPFIRNILFLSYEDSYIFIEYYILLMYIYVQLIRMLEEWIFVQKANYIIKRKY